MKSTRPRAGSIRIAILAGVAAFASLGACASALAGGGAYAPEAPTVQAGAANTIYMKFDKQGLRFSGPKTIVAGEELSIVNQSDPRKIGPHTFSLVTKASLPKTAKARQLCFTKDHICKEIATWHGVKGNGPVKVNPAEAGAAGWDTMGDADTKGDSWFTGNKKGTSFSQTVTADTSAGATRLYYICAIHSFMQGSINVLPGG